MCLIFQEAIKNDLGTSIRVAMKNAKTVIDDQDRARKAAVMGEVVASNKALDGALKQVKVLAPETPVIFFRRRAVATTLEVEDWRWLKSEKLWVGKVQLKAGEVKTVVETGRLKKRSYQACRRSCDEVQPTVGSCSKGSRCC